MKRSARNLWWPEFESGMRDVEDYIVKRMTDADVAAKHVKTKGIAVQAGGHVGLFPRQLSKIFGFVYTFEASPEMFECLQLNTDQYPNIIAQPAALGPTMGTVAFAERRSGRSRVDPTSPMYVPQITIDSLELPRCDLIYLDIEGYELPALAGAAATIVQFRPVIALEVWKGGQDLVKKWADDNRYNLAERVHSDWIFVP